MENSAEQLNKSEKKILLDALENEIVWMIRNVPGLHNKIYAVYKVYQKSGGKFDLEELVKLSRERTKV